MVLIICLILQLIIYIYVYNSILNNIEQSFTRSIIKILCYLKDYFRYSSKYGKSKRIKQFLNDNNGLNYVLYPLFYLGINILYAAFSSMIFNLTIHMRFLCFLFCFALLSIYIESLIKYRFIFISFFENFFIFYSLFQKKVNEENIGKNVIKKRKKIKINISKRELLAILIMIVSIVIMLYFFLEDFYKLLTGKKELDFGDASTWNIFPTDNMVFMIAFLVFAGSVLVILFGSATELDNLKRHIDVKIKIILQKIIRKKGNSNIDKRYLAPELKKLDKSINSLCQKLGIDYINILVDENLKQPAVAKSIVPPTVILQKGFVEQFVLKEELGKLMFVIGHELVHIRYKDTPAMKRESFKTFVVLSIIEVCGFYMTFMCIHFGLYVIVYFFVLTELFICIVMTIICDPRYWRQVAELRADRIGLEACGEKIEIFKSVMSQLEEEEEMVSWKSGLLKWYLMLYKDMDEHPCIKTRIYEVERGKQWCWKEYLRYCWLMMCNRATGKGWRL